MLNPDFSGFLQSLNDNRVRYLVVGGYAVALHGHPRYTKDLDIWIDGNPDNARRLVDALEDFGFASLNLSAGDFTEPDQVIQLGYPPARIDILNHLPGVSFDECYETRVETAIDAVMVAFIDLEHLKMNKRATGRMQDLADLEALE